MNDKQLTAEQIKVMQAFVDGKTIQSRGRFENDLSWNDLSSPSWGWDDFEYRVKSEPREFWIMEVENETRKIVLVYNQRERVEEYAKIYAERYKVTVTHVREVTE